MANELFLYNNNAITCYCIIRRELDGLVYDRVTPGWENYLDANIANYAIPLASQGGDLYSADHPAIANANYSYSFYTQAGATPAITDSLIHYFDASWTNAGSTAAAGTVVLDGYALTTLYLVKLQLGLDQSDTTYDDLLTNYINQYSALFETLCGRKIVARDYNEFGRSRWSQYITEEYPINSINKISWQIEESFEVKYTGTDILKAINVSESGVHVRSQTSAGVYSTNNYLFATYPTTQLIYNQISGLTGMTVGFHANHPAKYLQPTAGRTVKDVSVSLMAHSGDGYYNVVDIDTGVIGLISGNDTEYLCIDYNAGYTSVPYDIQNAVAELIRDNYTIQNGAPSDLKSVTLGDYSYSVGQSNNAVISDRIKSVIKNYAKASIA
jgi:hypothetical protein